VEAALATIAGEPIDTTCAGRTDRGVHAVEQVVHFDTQAERPDTAWVRGVNSGLPPQVAILWARRVDAKFHARYSATSRAYRYRLLNRPVRAALAAAHAGWFPLPLDLERMREAAALLVGQHDFSAFRSAECQATTPVRTLHSFDIEKQGDELAFKITANAFLHHMVRNLVGSLVYVGKGKHPPRWVRDVLESKDRGRAAPTFAPEGLYLEKVVYDASWGLPQ